MLFLTLKSIRANMTRFVLTGVAVVLGVAFMAGTLVLTDTIKKSYDDIATNVYKSTDAVVRSSREISTMPGMSDVRGTVDASALAKVRATPGVAAAEGQQTGVAVVVGRNGRLLEAHASHAIPLALAFGNTPALNPMKLTAGHAPQAANDIVIDQASYDKGRFHLGEMIRVVSPHGSDSYRLAGVVTYGGSSSAAGGAQVVAFTPSTATRVLGTNGRFSEIDVVAKPGYAQQTVVANIARTLHDPSVETITGVAAAAATRKANGASLQFMNIFLMTFAVIALVVGSFVIYNTFSITVAQRTKETALFRAIGANGRQVTRAVRIEALLTGITASAIGVVIGIGTARALRSALAAFGISLPAGSIVVQPRTIMMSMITGVAITLAAAFLPARKAAKVAPIQALRDVATDESAHSKRRVIFGVLATIMGALAIGQGLNGAGAITAGQGALLAFAGIVMLGPVVAKTFTRAVGLPLTYTRGAAGTLARENAGRNPRRTAATASALMIGVALVALITVFAASAKTSIKSAVDTGMKSNFVVDTQFGTGGLSPVVAHRIDALPETASVTSLQFTNAIVGDTSENVSGIDPGTVAHNLRLDVRSGDITKLDAHGVAVQTDTAGSKHLHLGDSVKVFFPETGNQRFRVVAIYGVSQPLGSYAVSTQAFNANVAQAVDNDVLVSDAPGVSMAQARTAIERVLADFPNANLRTKQEFKGEIANAIDQTLNLVYVLLAMALVIALFGIANTLALSVFERTREFGLLRAVGMNRSQVRSTVRLESVLIALLGTTMGTAIGVGVAAAILRASSQQQIHRVTVPTHQLLTIVLLAAVAAVGAAALPARRAATLDVLDAISE
jgi:putative ABC transport system permease protein